MANPLFDSILAGDRLALARAITLIESQNPEHQLEAAQLIDLALKLNKSSLRIGVTGAPGAGKSTFIDGLGSWLVNDKQKKVCVLAIDPSSQKNHGSILGDKTRMGKLSVLNDVFIRPSPASGNMGGIAKKTKETILLCESAGYDIILVETLGVGQSEYVADQVVDCLLLLLLPNAGDELQGIKRGIMELADLLIINKADITEPSILHQAISDVQNAIHFLPQKYEGWMPMVLQNAIENEGDKRKIWEQIEKFITFQKANGHFETKRILQKTEWLKEAIKEKLENRFFQNPKVKVAIENALRVWLNEGTGLDLITNRIIEEWRNNEN
jgi:LAO/AO transport system kinase